jgi:hypothetical protein
LVLWQAVRLEDQLIANSRLDEHPQDPRAPQVREFRDKVRRTHLAYQRR